MAHLGDRVDEAVDVTVVADHALAERIYDHLNAAGIRHVDFWPEDILSDSIGLAGHGYGEGVIRLRAHEPRGPFHIRVRGQDLAQARFILSAAGLLEGDPSATE
jgi:hypothetical protein